MRQQNHQGIRKAKGYQQFPAGPPLSMTGLPDQTPESTQPAQQQLLGFICLLQTRSHISGSTRATRPSLWKVRSAQENAMLLQTHTAGQLFSPRAPAISTGTTKPGETERPCSREGEHRVACQQGGKKSLKMEANLQAEGRDTVNSTKSEVLT